MHTGYLAPRWGLNQCQQTPSRKPSLPMQFLQRGCPTHVCQVTGMSGKLGTWDTKEERIAEGTRTQDCAEQMMLKCLQ